MATVSARMKALKGVGFIILLVIAVVIFST